VHGSCSTTSLLANLMQIGRQILTSPIAEQIARHEYRSLQQQIANGQKVDQFLHDKFTNVDLYLMKRS
jgi:Tc toxin complex TcA C-terminal TcB-binding domain